MSTQIIEATSEADFLAGANLFREYAASLEIDLCFQNFERELKALPEMYGPPSGRLLLAFFSSSSGDCAPQLGRPVGCVAVRRVEPGGCEMKRLYVAPRARQHGVGRALTQEIIHIAAQIGYERMRLDTLASMKPALAVYESLGFRRIQPYYHNPHGDAVFLELTLS